MRTIIAIVLVTLYVLAMLKPAMPLIRYYSQLQEYQERCINKSKPSMHCHGQCLLSQEMAHADNNNSDSPLLPKINFEDYPIAVLDHPFRSDTQPFEAGINSTDYLSSIVSLYYSEILKPPC